MAVLAEVAFPLVQRIADRGRAVGQRNLVEAGGTACVIGA